MHYKKVEKTVLVTDDGIELSFTKRPGTLDDWMREVEEARKQYPHLFERQSSLDEYYKDRREEALREWKE